MALVAALAMAVAPLATAAGPAAAASAGSSPAHPSLSYLKAHAKYDYAGSDLKGVPATSAPAATAVPLLSGVVDALAAAPLVSAAASSDVTGVDVSADQGDINWRADVVHFGAKFAYIKATEGSYYTNPDFASQYEGSFDHGLIRGAYVFANPDTSSGANQAEFFVRHGGGWSDDGKTLPGALDIEYDPYGQECYSLSKSAMVSWIRAFVNEYHALTTRWPVIYSTTNWWNTCTGGNSSFGSKDPLWLADFSSSPGATPPGWGFFTIWQYADSGVMPGDQDVFNGNLARLTALAKNT